MSVIGFQVRTAVLTPSTYVVSVSGEIDMHSSPALEEELNWVLGNGADNAIVDLVEVGFVDSTALKVLLEALPRFADRGGELILVSDDLRVQRTLEQLLGCRVDLVMRDAVKPQLRERIFSEAVRAT